VVADAGSQNVELRQAEATATGIAPASLDVAVMRHVLVVRYVSYLSFRSVG
jgi:hypothetical protein